MAAVTVVAAAHLRHNRRPGSTQAAAASKAAEAKFPIATAAAVQAHADNTTAARAATVTVTAPSVSGTVKDTRPRGSPKIFAHATPIPPTPLPSRTPSDLNPAPRLRLEPW